MKRDLKPVSWTFPERDSDPAGELWLPESPAPAPAVVLAPDLLGRPGRGLTSALAPELARRGYVALTAPPVNGCESSRFREATLRDRLGEVTRAVTAFFERMAAGGRVDIRRIALVGHGIGGTVAAAEAAHDSRVGAVALIGAPRTASSAFSRKANAVWDKGGTARILDPVSGDPFELGPNLATDWKAREEALDHANNAAATQAHVLWIHGTDDEQVTIEDSRRAYFKHPDGGRRARLVEVAGANHDFGIVGATNRDALASSAVPVADAIQELLERAFPTT